MTRSKGTALVPPLDDPEILLRKKKEPPVPPKQDMGNSHSTEFEEENGAPQSITIKKYFDDLLEYVKRPIIRLDPKADVDYTFSKTIWSEVRQTPFHGNDDEDVREHLRAVFGIANLFHRPGITMDEILLRMLPLTLKDKAWQWFRKIPEGTYNSWDAFKEDFVKKFESPKVISAFLHQIHTFKQKDSESLYQAWDRFYDLLFQCPSHDLKPYQEALTLYQGLNFESRMKMDSRRRILELTPEDAIKEMRDVVYHENGWNKPRAQQPTLNQPFAEVMSISTPLPKNDGVIELDEEVIHNFIKKTHEDNIKFEKQVAELVDGIKTQYMKNEVIISKLRLKVENLRNELTRYKHEAKPATFSEKVIERIKRDEAMKQSQSRVPHSFTKSLQHFISTKTPIETVASVKLNAFCSAIIQNELPPKEKDPGSFILPCKIGSTVISNALADLGASISVMPLSMFKRLKLGEIKPIKMVIEMADRSMQTPLGAAENVLVQIERFVFPVDFIILDITEDRRVPLILGRPMLATAHAKIDVFGKVITLEVEGEKATFNINQHDLQPVSVFAINDQAEPPDIDLNRFLQDDFDFDILDDSTEGDYSSVSEENMVFNTRPTFYPVGVRVHILNPYNLQILCKIGDAQLTPYLGISTPMNLISRRYYNYIMTNEIHYMGNNIVGFVHGIFIFVGKHTFKGDFLILEDMREFVENGLQEIIFGIPLISTLGLIIHETEGRIMFDVGGDKTMFCMPRALTKYKSKSLKEQNRLPPSIKICDLDEKKRIFTLEQKMSDFYQGCDQLGFEYKRYTTPTSGQFSYSGGT